MNGGAPDPLGQIDVAGRTNENTTFRPLPDPVHLARTVLPADALHTQREHADWLVSVQNAARSGSDLFKVTVALAYSAANGLGHYPVRLSCT